MPDRLIPFDQVARLVPYTRRTIDRLEAQGKFPKRVRLGRRVAWSEEEVRAWMAAKKGEREECL